MNHPRKPTSALLLGLCLMLGACSVSSRQAGVANVWREEGRLEGIEVGKTTMTEVMDKLGPPSQLFDLGGHTGMYYLLERAETDSLFLIVYNDSRGRTVYDRAVFMFDENFVLTHQSFSEEVVD